MINLVDFDPFCVFLGFKVAFELHEFACFHVLALKFFLPSYLNMASLDSPGEIVPIELPNPEETQI